MTAAPSRKPADTTYDEVLYESFTYPQSHPERSYTVGRLFSLTPPDFKTAKILELGCASGGNILSLAMAYPKAHFTGLDLSHEQIALANRNKKTLKLKNIDFIQQDITQFDMKAHEGAFDYIICHGVFSWVPAPVREKILELCDTCLSLHGLALISYNTLPGWNAVRSLREMMLFHVRTRETAAEKIAQARALLEFLLESIPDARTAYRETIAEELKLLKGTNDSYLFHDHLEDNNSQFYFHEFAALAQARGLQYVGDSVISTMFVENLPQSAATKLKAVNDIVMQEQYMDFIHNRRFRSSILCKSQLPMKRALNNMMIFDFYLSTPMKPESDNPDPKQPILFKMQNGAQFTTTSEAAGHLFLELAACAPELVSARDLVARTQKKMKLDKPDLVEAALIDSGLFLALRGHVHLHSDAPAFTRKISARPVAFPLARLQAASNQNTNSVTNALHTMIASDLFTNICIKMMDGQHTPDDIINHIVAEAKAGRLNVTKDNRILTEEQDIRAEITGKVTYTLGRCAAHAVLVG